MNMSVVCTTVNMVVGTLGSGVVGVGESRDSDVKRFMKGRGEAGNET